MHKNVAKKQIQTLSNKSSRESISVLNKWLKSIWKDFKDYNILPNIRFAILLRKKKFENFEWFAFSKLLPYIHFLLLYLFLNHK
jgi:hypothetical protein